MVVESKSEKVPITERALVQRIGRNPEQWATPPFVGVVPLKQKSLPDHLLFPTVTGSEATGLDGVWRARADMMTSIQTTRFRASAQVTDQELASIEAAVRAFLGFP